MIEEELKQEAEEYLKQKLEERKDKFVFELPEVYIKDVKETYLASAEPREKRIDILSQHILELQADKGRLTDRVKELEYQLTHRNCLDCSNHSSKLRMRTLELEKENAELEETLRTYNGCGDWDNDFHTCRVYLQHEELQMYIHQLTTAKEIMQKLIANAPDTYSGTNIELQQKKMFAFQNAINKAEQFLSEVE